VRRFPCRLIVERRLRAHLQAGAKAAGDVASDTYDAAKGTASEYAAAGQQKAGEAYDATAEVCCAYPYQTLKIPAAFSTTDGRSCWVCMRLYPAHMDRNP